MKITIAALTLALSACSPAYAGNNNNNSGGNSSTAAAAASASAAQQQGQQQGQAQNSANVNHNANVAGSFSGGNSQSSSVVVDTDVRPAASAPAISLTSVGTDNCLGSVSASAGNGFWAIGGGKTTESVECNRRAYSRALRDLGQKDAALSLLCLNPEVSSVTPSCAKPATVAVSSPGADQVVCARTGERCE